MQHQQQDVSDPVVKLIVVGSGGVGKSALTLNFMYQEFVEDYEPTKADSYRKTVNTDGEKWLIDILDTAGQEDYVGIRDNYYRTGEGFLLVFSINDQESLAALPGFYDQIIRTQKEDKVVPMILVMNKCDLQCEDSAFMLDQGKQLADRLGIEIVRTSAKLGENVEYVFLNFADQVRRRRMATVQRPKVLPYRKQRKRCNIL